MISLPGFKPPRRAAAFVSDALFDGRRLRALTIVDTFTREALAIEIRAKALAWAVAEASVEEIDQINILQASMLAMRRAVELLAVRPTRALVDGNRCPELSCPVEAVVGGDGLVASIAAASILAKTVRDAGMMTLHVTYPMYGFDRHMGYPTAAHVAALKEHGVSPVHRRSFGPVARLL